MTHVELTNMWGIDAEDVECGATGRLPAIGRRLEPAVGAKTPATGATKRGTGRKTAQGITSARRGSLLAHR